VSIEVHVSDDQQFDQYQQNMQSPLTSKQLSTKMTTAYHIGNPGSGFRHAQKDQIDAAKQCGAPVIELHTGHYADTTGAEQQAEFERIKNMATCRCHKSYSCLQH
jgi:pyridoxine 5'-phosphate synthase PdxJ